MSNSDVSPPSPLAGATAATPELSVMSNQHVANVSTAPPTHPSQVPFPIATASSVAASPSFLIPPIQTTVAPNPSIPFQIVRRKIIVHGTGGPACSIHQQTVPSEQNIVAVPEVLQIIQKQSAGKVQILPYEPSTNVQKLKNKPATNVQKLKNKPATNVQMLKNPPATNVQIRPKPPVANVRLLQNQPQNNIQIVQNPSQMNVQIVQSQPQFVNQLQRNFQVLENQPFGKMQVISGPTQVVQKPVQGSMKIVQNLQVASNQSQNVQNLQVASNQSQMVQNLQVASNQSRMVQNLQVTSIQSQNVQNLQVASNQSQMVQNLQVTSNQSQMVQNLQVTSIQSRMVQNLQVASNQSRMVQNLQVASNQSQMVQNLQRASNQSVQNQGMMLAQVQTPDGPQVVESKTGTLRQCPETGGQVFTPAGGGPPLPVHTHPSRAKSAPTPQDNIKKVVDTVTAHVPEKQTNTTDLLRDLLLPKFDELCPEVEKDVVECGKKKNVVEGGKKKKRKRKMVGMEIFDEERTNKPPVFFNIDKPCTVDSEMEISFGGTSLIPKFAIEFCPGGLHNYVSAVAQAAITYKSKAELAKLEHEAKLERRRLKQENRNHALKIMKMAKEAESSIKISRRKQTLAIRNDHFDDDVEIQSGSTTKKKCKLISASIVHAKKSKKTAHKRMKSKGFKGSVSKTPSEHDESSIKLSRRKQTLATRSDHFDDVKFQSGSTTKKKCKSISASTAHERMISKSLKDNVSKIPSEQDEAVTDVIAEEDLGKVTINPDTGNSNTDETLATVEIVTDKSVMSTASASPEVPIEVAVFIPPSISKEDPLRPAAVDPAVDLAVDPAVINITHTGSNQIRIAVSNPGSITEVQLPLPVHKIKIEPRECSRLLNPASSSSTTSSSTSMQATHHALHSHEEGKAIEPGTDMDTCSSVSTASPVLVKSVKMEPVEANIKQELDPRKMTSEDLPSADPFELGKMPPKTKENKKRVSAMDIPKPVGVHKTETPDMTRTSEDTLPGTKAPPSASRRKTARTIVAPSRYRPCKTTGVRVKKPAQVFEQSKQAPVLGPFNFISKPSEICVTPQVPTSVNCDTVQKKPVFIVSESVYKALYNAHTTGKSLHLNSSPSVPPVSKNGQTANCQAKFQLETDILLKQVLSNEPNSQQFQMATGQVLDEPHSQLGSGQSSQSVSQIVQVASEKSTGQTATPVGMQNLPTMMSRHALLHQAFTSSQGENSKHLTTPIMQQLNSTQRSSPLPYKSNQNSKDEGVVIRVPGIQARPVHPIAIIQDLKSFLENSVNEISHNRDAFASELNIDSVCSLNEASCNLMNKVPSYLEMCLNSKLEHSLGLCLVVLDRKMPPGFRGERESKTSRLPVPRACAESCRTSSLNLMCNSNMLDSVKLGQIEEVVSVSKCVQIQEI